MTRTAFDHYVVEYIELWLSALGLAVIWAIPQFLTPEVGDRWRTTALTAIAVGLVHGVIFWVVRRRRQKVKTQAQALIEQENVQLEKRVSERTEQLRTLASELAMAEQRERHRLAVVLHDHVQQLLFSVQMRMQYLLKNSGSTRAPEIETMNTLIGKAIASTRDLSLELSPPVLAGEGLDQALQWLVFQMNDMHRLDIHFANHSANTDVDEAMRVLLFQVVRELLSGAAERAHNHPVMVTLEDGANDVVTIELQGLHAQQNAMLRRLRERLYFVGGRVDAQSQSEQYPLIKITAPKSTQPPDNGRPSDGE